MNVLAPEVVVRHHRLRRMTGRDPQERHRGASPLELLFDLTFVVAFAQAGDQVAHFLAEGHIATAVWGFAFVVFSVCWAWLLFTWFASAFDTDDWLHRVLTMIHMVGVVIVALGIPAVFESIDHGEPFDFRIVAGGYVVMRIALVAMYLRVARESPAHRQPMIRYAIGTAVAQVAWTVVAFLRIEDMTLLVTLVVLLWAIELAVPVWATWGTRDGNRRWQGSPWHAHHITERFGLFVIITLGEGILGTIAAVSAAVAHEGGWTLEPVLVVVAGVGLTFGLWWMYFIVPSSQVLAVHRERNWTWGYGHILLFGSLAAVGAGLHVAAYAAEGVAIIGTVGVVLSVAIPVLVFTVVYFTLYSVLFRNLDTFHLWLAAGMIAFLAAGVLLAIAGVPLGWCLLVVMLSPAVVVVGFETVGFRHVMADVARIQGVPLRFEARDGSVSEVSRPE